MGNSETSPPKSPQHADKQAPSDNPSSTTKRIHREATDELFPQHWKSGSLKYTDFKPLTEGGTAELQTCLDRNLNRIVVYKTLHPHLASSEMENARFLREARVTALISHPGTVPLYEIGRDRSGAMYFTMKKLEGRDLSAILKGRSARYREMEAEYPLSRLIDIMIQVCQTLSFAHASGIIHRDIKPANILVGPFGEVTVLDWGLAKVQGEEVKDLESLASVEVPQGKEAVRMEMTQPGQRYGTPLYMSPEQAEGKASIDERTDIYNMGSLLFEILTRESLVFGSKIDEVLAMILERPTPEPIKVAPREDIPKELNAICIKALQKDPDDRYQSMNDFCNDLIAYRNDGRVSVYRHTLRESIAKFNQRHVIALTALGSLIAGALLCWLFLNVAQSAGS
ncbi:serine/threonine protein kinase [Mucisphaera sp.]|uniref:serine/threonine protein kinase n=1 Tax=Mucisphaera sp. TaxID=2913024 RepID=UPI003D14C89A